MSIRRYDEDFMFGLRDYVKDDISDDVVMSIIAAKQIRNTMDAAEESRYNQRASRMTLADAEKKVKGFLNKISVNNMDKMCSQIEIIIDHNEDVINFVVKQLLIEVTRVRTMPKSEETLANLQYYGELFARLCNRIDGMEAIYEQIQLAVKGETSSLCREPLSNAQLSNILIFIAILCNNKSVDRKYVAGLQRIMEQRVLDIISAAEADPGKDQLDKMSGIIGPYMYYLVRLNDASFMNKRALEDMKARAQKLGAQRFKFFIIDLLDLHKKLTVGS